jgi:hypothetical protein
VRAVHAPIKCVSVVCSNQVWRRSIERLAKVHMHTMLARTHYLLHVAHTHALLARTHALLARTRTCAFFV